VGSYRSNQAFLLFRTPHSLIPDSKRRLLVVSWANPTTIESIIRYMLMFGRGAPADMDVVHVTCNLVSWALFNPWSTNGNLGYLSLSVAQYALPGYAGYMQTNDDVVMFWDNLPRSSLHSWHGRSLFALHFSSNQLPHFDSPLQWHRVFKVFVEGDKEYKDSLGPVEQGNLLLVVYEN